VLPTTSSTPVLLFACSVADDVEHASIVVRLQRAGDLVVESASSVAAAPICGHDRGPRR